MLHALCFVRDTFHHSPVVVVVVVAAVCCVLCCMCCVLCVLLLFVVWLNPIIRLVVMLLCFYVNKNKNTLIVWV